MLGVSGRDIKLILFTNWSYFVLDFFLISSSLKDIQFPAKYKCSNISLLPLKITPTPMSATDLCNLVQKNPNYLSELLPPFQYSLRTQTKCCTQNHLVVIEICAFISDTHVQLYLSHGCQRYIPLQV